MRDLTDKKEQEEFEEEFEEEFDIDDNWTDYLVEDIDYGGKEDSIDIDGEELGGYPEGEPDPQILNEMIEEDEELASPEEVEFVPEEDILLAMEGEEPEYVEETEEPVNKDTIHDSSGQPVEFQTSGKMTVEEIPLNEIFFPPRTRRGPVSDTEDLEALIIQWGLIEPLHVIPFNGKYLLVHGFRRYQALKNLNYETAICLVDTTRPKTTVRFLEVLCNNSQKFDFFEMMNFGEFIERKQSTFQNETIEKILGMEAGDYLKAKYLRQFDKFGIINEVVLGKRSIKDGFKRLERELVKEEKEKLEMMEMEFDEQGMPIMPEDVTEAIEEEVTNQTTKDRQPLPAHVYARVKARDKYTCQSCGIGHTQPELNSIFEVHHIIPVSMNGNDGDDNLILVCANCHKVITSYIAGEFKPPAGSQDMYKNMILMGNIPRLKLADDKGSYNYYMSKCDQPWLDDEYYN